MSKSEASKKDLLIHIGLAGVASVVILLFVFYMYLPITTNHGESMTVPNLEGILLEDLEEFLEERDLRYEVESDSGYSPKFPPLAVLKQFPLPQAKVKEGRKIYITLNATKPPVVKMPSLIQRSLKNAQLELRSLGLLLGDIKYKPDFALNTILAQYYEGKKLNGGEEIPKGSKIDFEVGDGLGNQSFQMLNLTNMGLDEAVFVMRGYGLKLGDVFYEDQGKIIKEKEVSGGEVVTETIEARPGKVFKHSPNDKNIAKIGQEIDLWIVKVDSAAIEEVPTLDLGTE
ncbi:PASTA domain-containing protein [Reichenbachiella carrageenanivorans]|uniref:PASTA domain-containing protein n=1 Tax=Reichenbachiella carrageenanivorans TaxID=2979869 RepID=A0ABY6CY07_9BACT|nr:PASTA domain-containing protein [Reichenbachiella carrageenanivorans]UXX78758.1 PASTA domain-containing protein [Reichenbachiella carrageenanivorans]